MKNLRKLTCLCLLAFLVLFQNCKERKKSVPGKEAPESAQDNTGESYYTEADFPLVKKFNTHVHINIFDSTFIKQATADNFRFLTVNVDAPSIPIDQQQKVALRLVKAFPWKNFLRYDVFG